MPKYSITITSDSRSEIVAAQYGLSAIAALDEIHRFIRKRLLDNDFNSQEELVDFLDNYIEEATDGIPIYTITGFED